MSKVIYFSVDPCTLISNYVKPLLIFWGTVGLTGIHAFHTVCDFLLQQHNGLYCSLYKDAVSIETV
jgi:hypothetical protein